MSVIGDSVQAEAKTAVPLGPEGWEPGNEPDPLIQRESGLIGAPVSRLDGALKVTGAAPFAADVQMDGLLYASLAFSTIAKGRLATLDTSAAESAPGVVLVMTHRNAPPHEADAAVHDVGKGGRRRRPARDAGRPDPLERPADRGRARRDAGAGRPRQVADPRHLRDRGGGDRLRRGEIASAALLRSGERR